MIQKLYWKFVVINMTIVTMMLCVILGMVFYFTRNNLESESINMMQTIATRPFQLQPPGNTDEDIRLPYFIVHLGPKGEVLTTNGGYYDLSNEEFLHILIKEAASRPQTLGVLKNYNLRYYRLDTPMDHCLVFADISSERTTLQHLLQTCMLIGAASFLLFLGISLKLAAWAIQPVEWAWKQQRQFVADASHELQPPLTVILTNAELVESLEYDEESRSRFVQGIRTEACQMKGLIEEMLELARADQSDTNTNLTVFRMDELVTEEVLSFEPVFYERGIILESMTDMEPLLMKGDLKQLRRVIDILLDNAQKYARKQGHVRVSLTSGERTCILEVSNEGNPLSEEDQERIFKRFYRGDQARSRSGSYGLGLSIAQAIVHRHKGQIRVESMRGWNRFYVELPR